MPKWTIKPIIIIIITSPTYISKKNILHWCCLNFYTWMLNNKIIPYFFYIPIHNTFTLKIGYNPLVFHDLTICNFQITKPGCINKSSEVEEVSFSRFSVWNAPPESYMIRIRSVEFLLLSNTFNLASKQWFDDEFWRSVTVSVLRSSTRVWLNC